MRLLIYSLSSNNFLPTGTTEVQGLGGFVFILNYFSLDLFTKKSRSRMGGV